MGSLAEDPPEDAAEMARRDMCLPSQNPQVEGLAVTAVDEIAGAEQVPL